MKRIFIFLLLALAHLSIPLFASEKPSVIIIVADDLGYGDVGFHGSDIETPNLDRLANEGARLEAFYSCPMCSPTRAGLMTGRYPIRYGLMRAVVPPQRDYGLDVEEETLADVFAKAGYEHRGIVGKWHLGHRRLEWFPTRRGFTFFVGCLNGAIDYFTLERDGELDWHRNEDPYPQEGYATDLIGDAAVEFIESVPDDEPYLLYLPFNAPHSPFQAKEEDLAKYPHREGRKRTLAAMVDSMDQAIGRVFDAAESRSDWDNTFILFFSDNGGVNNVGDNGELRGSKLTPYQGGIRVAAAAYWKNGGIVGGKRIAEHMGYIDVLPTMRRIIGAEDAPKKPLDGIDVLDAMKGQASLPTRSWFTYHDQNDNRVQRLAVNRGKFKLVGHVPAPDSEGGEAKWELFEIWNDPNEKLEVSARNPESFDKLKKELESFLELRRDDQIIRFRIGAQDTPALPQWTPNR